MIALEWVVFLIAFVGGLLKALYEGKGVKFTLASIILVTIIATIVGIVFGFVFSWILGETFELNATTLLTYLVDAFVGSILTPLALYVTSIKIE